MNQASCNISLPNGRTLVSVHGDITRERVDAIVNAANSRLIHGGGVAAAISRAGGPEIQEESRKAAPIRTGDAKTTRAGTLPCRFVIHAVGPVWGGGSSNEEALLASSVENALCRAAENDCRSLSLPAISSGIFGFPKNRAAAIIVGTVLQYLETNPDTSLTEIRFCNVEPDMVALYDQELSSRFTCGESGPALDGPP